MQLVLLFTQLNLFLRAIFLSLDFLYYLIVFYCIDRIYLRENAHSKATNRNVENVGYKNYMYFNH
jgi:hypothetical protein